MPSVARELPLDQPLYRRADLNDHRRNILRLARSFPPGSERNHHRQVASLFRALFKNKSGWMRILLRALAASVIAIHSPLRRRRRKPDRIAAVEPPHATARSFIASEGRFSGRHPWHLAPGRRHRQSAARGPLPRPRASSAYCDVFHRSTWQVQPRLAAVDNAPGFVDEQNVP